MMMNNVRSRACIESRSRNSGSEIMGHMRGAVFVEKGRDRPINQRDVLQGEQAMRLRSIPLEGSAQCIDLYHCDIVHQDFFRETYDQIALITRRANHSNAFSDLDKIIRHSNFFIVLRLKSESDDSEGLAYNTTYSTVILAADVACDRFSGLYYPSIPRSRPCCRTLEDAVAFSRYKSGL